MRVASDRAWWVIESVFLRLPDKRFWACLGDLQPDIPSWPETWVLLCNLMLKLRGISRNSAILGSDSPQSNNRRDNSLWRKPFIPCKRPDVKHAITRYCRLFKATTACTSASTDARATLATGNPPEDYGQIRGGCSFPWMIAID